MEGQAGRGAGRQVKQAHHAHEERAAQSHRPAQGRARGSPGRRLTRSRLPSRQPPGKRPPPARPPPSLASAKRRFRAGIPPSPDAPGCSPRRRHRLLGPLLGRPARTRSEPPAAARQGARAHTGEGLGSRRRPGRHEPAPRWGGGDATAAAQPQPSPGLTDSAVDKASTPCPATTAATSAGALTSLSNSSRPPAC